MMKIVKRCTYSVMSDDHPFMLSIDYCTYVYLNLFIKLYSSRAEGL